MEYIFKVYLKSSFYALNALNAGEFANATPHNHFGGTNVFTRNLVEAKLYE